MKPFKKKFVPAKKKSKRRNDKRKCGFCKITFPSQRTYNNHVNTCVEKR